MIALIDADIITYRIGFTTEDISEEELWVVESRIDDLIFDIKETLQPDDMELFLTSTDKSNFRFSLYPEYKANRKKPKPKWYEYIRNYLVNTYNASIVYGMEADDALSIRQMQCQETIICSIDKDLLQVPGKHYNFVTKARNTISKSEGAANFYKQLLVGDSGDNIPGCPGIGEAKSNKLVIADISEQDMFDTVYKTYKQQYASKKMENFEEDMLRNGQLLKLKTTITESLWSFPTQPPQLVDNEQSSTLTSESLPSSTTELTKGQKDI